MRSGAAAHRDPGSRPLRLVRNRALPADRQHELCASACFAPEKCGDGATCWAKGYIETALAKRPTTAKAARRGALARAIYHSRRTTTDSAPKATAGGTR